MARKVWVLDTGTKGTGASIVPLEKPPAEPRRKADLPYVAPKRAPRPPKPPEPRKPRRFKVVDVVTGEVLAEDTGVRATLDVLGDVRSVVDVKVSVWRPEPESWRLLTLAEQKALWARRAAPQR
ncbi:MAG: hypothetical protein QOH72_160 [Solirubrobacteraceae bacterium]|jgi:hypothetical protein|nr:hypothetical protein [Solirubrobacteraceae bacterium]